MNIVDILETPINHETQPHCCGCWNIVYDPEIGLPKLVCNECGVEVPLQLPSELDVILGEMRKTLQECREIQVRLKSL